MLFADSEGHWFLILFAVLGFLGEGVVRLTNRMLALRLTIRAWATGLGIVVGIFGLLLLIGEQKSRSPEDLLSCIFGAGLIGACGGLTAFLVVAVIVFIFQYVVAPPIRFCGRVISWPFRRWARSRDERHQRRMQHEQNQARNSLAAGRADAQKRRADARAACELLYHRHAHALASRFPKAAFDDFVNKFMGDDHAPDEVEARGLQLRDTILEHAQSVEPPAAPYTIESLTEWYVSTKQKIERLPLDDRYKQAQLAQLNTRYAELVQELMGSLQP